MRVAVVNHATTSNVIALGLIVVAGIPAVLLRAGLLSAPSEVSTLVFGLGIVSAAFAMSWGAEAAERDIPRALALIVVALLAVLPEYAVDVVLAWKAGADPSFAPYAVANMTGSNRLLLGVGWPMVALLAWSVRGDRLIRLDRGNIRGLLFLAAATGYSFVLPFKARISLTDSVVLIALFAGYAVAAARSESVEPDLIDEFLLVQWLAPFASEAPEFIVAGLLAVRGKPSVALGVLLSSKVNQWTLLVGSLPIAYSIGASHVAPLPLDQRQVAEVLLTAAQSLFGVGVLASVSLSLSESGVLAGLFFGQLALGGLLHTHWRDSGWAGTELLEFAALYVVLAVGAFLRALAAHNWRVRRS